MRAAEKVFKEMGFSRTLDSKDVIEYSNKGCAEPEHSTMYIRFYRDDGSYELYRTHGTCSNWIRLTPDLNHAIQLQLKELG